MIKHSQRRFGWTALSAAIAAASSLSMPAQAFQFYLGDIEGSLDTTLTAGASWRVEKRDKDYLAQGSLPNYGKGTTGSSTNNTDDGDWNYDRGKTFSKVVKGTTDLLMSYENFGGFTRLRYFYDRELMDESRAADPLGQTRPLNDDTLDQAGSDVRFLDAYVWGDFYAGKVPSSWVVSTRSTRSTSLRLVHLVPRSRMFCCRSTCCIPPSVSLPT
jgi:hypothetical protein